MKRARPLRFARVVSVLMTLLLLGFIFANSAQTAAVSAYRSGTVTQQLSGLLNFNGSTLPLEKLVRKLAHFAEYTALGICLTVLLAAFFCTLRLWPAALLGGASAAFCDEIIQFFTPGRSCELRDMLLDTCGVGFGIFCIFAGCKIFSALWRRFAPRRFL